MSYTSKDSKINESNTDAVKDSTLKSIKEVLFGKEKTLENNRKEQQGDQSDQNHGFLHFHLLLVPANVELRSVVDRWGDVP